MHRLSGPHETAGGGFAQGGHFVMIGHRSAALIIDIDPPDLPRPKGQGLGMWLLSLSSGTEAIDRS